MVAVASFAAALVFVASGMVHAETDGPIRPTGRDLSLKWKSGTYAYRWFPLAGTPHTASQAEKDAMEWTLFARTLEVVRAASDLCPVETRYAYTQLNVVTTRVGVGSQYEGALQKPGGGVWEVGANGRHYAVERSILRRFRRCLTGLRQRKACAERFGVAAMVELRDLLDLNEACDGPAEFAFGQVPRTVDGAREDDAPVDTRRLLPPRTTTQLERLHQTHMAHEAVSSWRCGQAPEPAPGLVRDAHFAYEQTAQTETERHFFALKPFSGHQDPRWTPEELCLWARIQDVFHRQWMDAQMAGDWAAARRNDTDHLFAHLCMNDATPKLRVLFSCGNRQRIDACGKLRCRDALSLLSARLGL